MKMLTIDVISWNIIYIFSNIDHSDEKKKKKKKDKEKEAKPEMVSWADYVGILSNYRWFIDQCSARKQQVGLQMPISKLHIILYQLCRPKTMIINYYIP